MAEAPRRAPHQHRSRPRSSASRRWSAPGSSRCSAPPARSPARPSGCRSCWPAASRRCRATRSRKLGARYPSAGGLLEYVNRGFGDGHVATVVAWLVYIANGIVTAMVALSFGSYASSAFAGRRRRRDQGLRGRPAGGDDRPQRRRLVARRPRPEPRRLRGHRHPRRLRRRDHREHRARQPRAVHLSGRPATSCPASR